MSLESVSKMRGKNNINASKTAQQPLNIFDKIWIENDHKISFYCLTYCYRLDVELHSKIPPLL